MPTLAQALLLGGERLATPPPSPHASLTAAWAQLDWAGARETSLLTAATLAGTARAAGIVAAGPLSGIEPAPAETQPLAPAAAVAVLRQLFAEEARPLLPEWLELCSRRGARVPPFFLRALLDLVRTPAERSAATAVLGERGRWLARHNPAWSWVFATAPAPALADWETGGEDERIGVLRHVRATDPAQARTLAEKTWPDDSPEFRARVLDVLATNSSLADEPLLLRALGERRKELRVAAQGILAALPDSALARRMRATAEGVLQFHSGFLSKKLEVALPAAFDPAWKADGIEAKPPAGVGEKAHWAQQILSLVPVRVWTEKFRLDATALVALAAKSGDWSDLLLSAWSRAALLHREPEAAAALAEAILAGAGKARTPASNDSLISLLLIAPEAARWRLLAADEMIAWQILGQFMGTPSVAQGRTLLTLLAPSLRSGYNPGGSPTAMLAARRIPPTLRDEATRLLTQDHGLSKPAEAFLRALELRAAMHAAFA